jgi:hypothetical protein
MNKEQIHFGAILKEQDKYEQELLKELNQLVKEYENPIKFIDSIISKSQAREMSLWSEYKEKMRIFWKFGKII